MYSGLFAVKSLFAVELTTFHLVRFLFDPSFDKYFLP